MTRRTWTSKGLLTAAPAFACLALVACGSDDDDDATDTTAAAVTTAPATSAAAATTQATETSAQAGDSSGETIEVVGSDYAFGGIPATVAPGTRFTLTNASDVELHELVAFKVPEGETRTLEEIVALPPAEQEAIFGQGPPAMVQIAMPASDEAIMPLGDGTVTEPGRYVVACFIPQGADPQEYMEAAQQSSEGPPQVEGGPPHIALGMYAEFTVEG